MEGNKASKTLNIEYDLKLLNYKVLRHLNWYCYKISKYLQSISFYFESKNFKSKKNFNV